MINELAEEGVNRVAQLAKTVGEESALIRQLEAQPAFLGSAHHPAKRNVSLARVVVPPANVGMHACEPDLP